MGKIFKNNIYYLMSAIIILGILVPQLILTVYDLKKSEIEILEADHKNFETTAFLLTESVSKFFWEYSKQDVLSIVDASLRDSRIVNIAIVDLKDEVFCKSSENITNYQYKSFEQLSKNIYYKNRRIGKLILKYEIDTISRDIRQRQFKDIISRIFQSLIIATLMFAFLHFIIIKRINKLIQNATDLTNRKLDNSFEWKDGDSIDSLGQDLEKARISLLDLFTEVNLKNIELQNLNKALEDKVEEKTLQVVHSARMAALGEMAAGIAHEINNPLTVINGKAMLMKRQLSEAGINNNEVFDSIDKILKMSVRITKIVKSLRFFSRNTDNEPRIEIEIKSIIDDTLDLCTEKMKFHNIEFKYSQIPEIKIKVNNIQISQVLLNLINNSVDAIKNNEDGKWISLSVEHSERSVKFIVADSGNGIPANIADKIMQPFFSTKFNDQGTGLGLSISTGIIQDHFGKLYIDQSTANTTFVVELPRG